MMANAGAGGTPGPASQTLSRGIRILEVLADAHRALTIDEIASGLDVHRSIAYRLVRTLEDHGLVSRDAAGLVTLGVRLAALSAGVARNLQAETLPELTAIANELGMTSFLAVLERDQCVTLASVEPRHAVASMAQRPGASHPVIVGAPGKAILSLLPESEWPDGMSAHLADEVRAIRAGAIATSHDEVIPTVRAVAAPLSVRGQRPAAIAVVHLGATPADETAIAARLERSIAVIREAFGEG
ncbi:IclR family transcriptional regulator [Microbacterium gorillae]|uniref:IclR family transcriptional regulator n=1 Tax=Microbacterium gorillae TaxID=1231063 RepID=UPI00058CFC0A|nr:helix-turn-helix domain-containing protein [Microbacterium gorillae]